MKEEEAVISDIEAENIVLRSMCYRAALEIESQWEHHCDEDGYGPVNLIRRLKGTFGHDLYAAGVSDEEIKKYLKFKSKTKQ